MRLPDYSKLFVDGNTVDSVYGAVTLRSFEAGRLTLTTGRIVACDAFITETTPYTTAVEPGTYPVLLSVAHFSDNDQRVAAAMLQISDRQPVAWAMALIPEQDIATLEEGEIFGYPVDSGTGCFMDVEAAEVLWSQEELEETLMHELDKTYVDTWSWANLAIEDSRSLNIIAFSTGMGDGLYASYFGFDEAHQVTCLITDFALFENEAI